MPSHSAIELERQVSGGSLYDSALEGRFFDVLLDLVTGSVPEVSVLLFGQDTANPSGNFFLHRGLKPDAIRSYVTELAGSDPWFTQQWRQIAGRVYQDHELLSREAFLQTHFYRQWLSRQDPLECATGIVIYRSGTAQWVLEVRYCEYQAKVSRLRATSFLEEISDHLVRAAKVFQLRVNHPAENESIANLLELMPFPIFILNPDGRVHNMNAKAAAMTRLLEGFFVSADGYLNAIDQSGHAELKKAIRNLEAVGQRSSEMFSMHKGGGEGRLFLTLTTMGAGFHHDIKAFGAYRNVENRIVLIVQDSEKPLRLTHDALWRAFGLTGAESELAISLLDGARIGDCALLREVSKQTLRNQLLAVMRKTNTHRQAELVSLLTRMALSASF